MRAGGDAVLSAFHGRRGHKVVGILIGATLMAGIEFWTTVGCFIIR